jgi:phage terminase large subunit
MAYQPFAVQKRAHRAILVDGFRRGMLFWSRRTGKTLWSVQQLMMSCMLNQGPHHIVFKEYQQAETVAWNQYIPLIPKELIKETNKSTLTVTFNYFEGKIKLPFCNGSCKTIDGELMHYDDCDCVVLVPDYKKPPASIRLLGSDKADSHRGGESYGMIFDEYQDQDHYGWDFVYRQFLYTTGGWAVFMGTAKSDDPWIEMLEFAESSYMETQKKLELGGKIDYGDWYYSKATWRENPLIKPEIIEADREQSEREGKMGAFLQETELIPFTLQGAVYPEYQKRLHHVPAEKIPKEGTDYIFLDFGFAEGHPMAACFVRITRDDIWYQWDEIFGTGIHIDDLIADIRRKMADRRLTAIIADSARPDLIDYMVSKGMPVIPAGKSQNSIAAGIQLFARRLRPKLQLIGEPKPNYYLDTVACPNTHYQFTHYRYKEIKQNRNPEENPEKKHDDAMDALRYGELFFKYGQTKSDKLPTASLTKEFNGYGLL